MSLDVTGIEEQVSTELGRSLNAYPNPTAGRTAISYSLSHSTAVSCVVYDAAGNIVSRLQAGTQPPGEHRLTWNAAGLEPGVYFCKLNAGGSTSAVRLTLVR
jgi:hypothetical protein